MLCLGRYFGWSRLTALDGGANGEPCGGGVTTTTGTVGRAFPWDAASTPSCSKRQATEWPTPNKTRRMVYGAADVSLRLGLPLSPRGRTVSRSIPNPCSAFGISKWGYTRYMRREGEGVRKGGGCAVEVERVIGQSL